MSTVSEEARGGGEEGGCGGATYGRSVEATGVAANKRPRPCILPSAPPVTRMPFT